MQLSAQGAGNESMAGDASNVSQDAVGALKPEVVGVLGGGQLGKMIAVAAVRVFFMPSTVPSSWILAVSS
jgi:hypothetical protein